MDYNSSEETIGWIKDRYLEESLEIKPPYQRKPVWVLRQKAHLAESVLLKLPVPEIYIQRSTSAEGQTSYAVVDGQQRIRAILQFIGVEQETGETEFNGFELEKLDNKASPWRNATFQGLTEIQRREFFNYRLSVRFLNTESDDEVRDMFRRLNKYLTKLSDQELRNATYSGPFVKFAGDLAEDIFWTENRIFTPQTIRRMGDIEFVSELIIGVIHGPQGGSARIIDEYYAQYEEFEDEFSGQAEAKRIYAKTLRAIQAILPGLESGTRWKNRTDFYTLFVAMAHLLRERNLQESEHPSLVRSLIRFEGQIDRRLADESKEVPDRVVKYVRAVEKGVSDKARRAARHEALLSVISKHFSART